MSGDSRFVTDHSSCGLLRGTEHPWQPDNRNVVQHVETRKMEGAMKLDGSVSQSLIGLLNLIRSLQGSLLVLVAFSVSLFVFCRVSKARDGRQNNFMGMYMYMSVKRAVRRPFQCSMH